MSCCTDRDEGAWAVAAGEAVEAVPARRSLRALLFGLTITGILVLLFGVPWWTLVVADARWPGGVVLAGTAGFALALVAFPVLMVLGHGRRHRDWAAVAGDTLLGVVWVLFSWAVIGNVATLALAVGGVADPLRSRVVAVGTLGISIVLMLWGYLEAMRLPRVKRVDVALPRLGAGLSGVRVVLLTDTHYGPLDRARWSARVAAVVNSLDADVVCHTGDLADGPVARRRAQVAPLGTVRARLARTYVTGNHEYFGAADGWLAHMRELGWEPLHNRHIVVERGGARLVLAGVDDATAGSSGQSGHRADHAAALAGADPARRSHAALHQPGYRLLGAATADLRAERNHRADPPPGMRSGRSDTTEHRYGNHADRPGTRRPATVAGESRGMTTTKRRLIDGALQAI